MESSTEFVATLDEKMSKGESGRPLAYTDANIYITSQWQGPLTELRPDGAKAAIPGRGSGWTKPRRRSRHATGLVGPPLFGNKPLAKALMFGKDGSLSKAFNRIGRRLLATEA
uniref:Uncharacterized protein n=1 Tax=Plectus sambesii TaxID=2011161 RepID=A0A914VUB1_9BILA